MESTFDGFPINQVIIILVMTVYSRSTYAGDLDL